MKTQTERLDKSHPGWRETAATRAFADWALMQPLTTRATILANGDEIINAKAVGEILTRFAARQE